MELLLGSAVEPLLFMMIDSVDHISGKTGLAPTVVISKNGGAFAAPVGAISEVGNGLYKIAPNATDTNTLGPLWIHATAAGADPVDDRSYRVVSYNPYDANALGLANLAHSSIQADVRSGILTVGGGTGTVAWEYFVKTPANLPLPGAQVTVTSDAHGLNPLGTVVSDNTGRALFFLTPGTYYFWSQKAGWWFNNPDTEVVT